MLLNRYIVVDGSQSGHDCCFEATIVDTTKPYGFGGNQSFEKVCECLDKEDAELIAALLNRAHGRTTTKAAPASELKVRSLEKEADELSRQIDILVGKKQSVLKQIHKIRADGLIKEHGISLEKTHLSHGDDVPYFIFAARFAEWVDSQREKKPFVEWNGAIYFRDVFTSGNMDGYTGVNIDDLDGNP